MTTNTTYHITSLLEKMVSSDKDYRFMATNDLMAELQKDSIKLDDDCERKVVKSLLKLLEDSNGEVQNLAVKCLGPLISKVKEHQVETIVETLCNNMMSEKEQTRDISSIGLKTVIQELPPSATGLANNVCRRVTGKLTMAIKKSKSDGPSQNVSVQLEALEILSDILSRFGNLLVSFHPQIQEALVPQLESRRMAVRKRTIIALGNLSVVSNNSLFDELIQYLLKQLQNKSMEKSNIRTLVQCLASIVRQAGHRIGPYLSSLIPIFMQFFSVDDDELKEYCIQAFESFILRAPKEISEFIPQIIELCLKYLSYDPNYNYDDDTDEEFENAHEDMDVDEEDEDDNEDYSDDDDMSWKVRRASAKCLNALVSTRHHMLSQLYTVVSPVLISRFKEREENVKSDIFSVYISLLRQTKAFTSGSLDHSDLSEDHPINKLRGQLANIVRSVTRQLREKSVKTRQSCFSLLTELIRVLPGCLSPHMQSVIPGVTFSLSADKNNNSTMKIDALMFLNTLAATHNDAITPQHLVSLVQVVIAAVGDSFYKIVSEALQVAQQLIKVIRPLSPEPSSPNEQACAHLRQIYDCTLVRLRASDIDQEVKERAISCTGQLMANAADVLNNQLTTCLPILVERLRNEITRLTTVKAFTLVASSPLKIKLEPYLAEAVPILATFLRKTIRALKLTTLVCLDSLFNNYSQAVSPKMVEDVMTECGTLINESDLHISQVTITLLTTICRTHPSSMALIRGPILDQLLMLLRSPLLQGQPLYVMMEFIRSLSGTNTSGLMYQDLMSLLTEPIYHMNTGGDPSHSHSLALHKQAFHSISKCVAALALSADPNAVINEFLVGLSKSADSASNKQTESIQLFSLLTLGEIGRHMDMSRHSKLSGVLLRAFSSSSEDVKTAASYSLGGVAIGNLSRYLPLVLQEIDNQPKQQYLLLHSLKEIISSESTQDLVATFRPHISTIWTMLATHATSSEEGTRNLVAECLGKLVLLQPDELLPLLKQHAEDESALKRATIITAVKFTISDQPQNVDTLLRQHMGDFFKLLKDTDINVRRVSLVMFNSAVHNKPSLVRDLLPSMLSSVYNETKSRPELVRQVEMGPFLHEVDDGLDLRKAAFECMYTLLESCLDQLDLFEFLTHVESGLKDVYDIKMLTFLILVRLVHLSPGPVLQRIDGLVEQLKVTMHSKAKNNAVKQEQEKLDELKRSAMRAVIALQSISGSDKNKPLSDLVSEIKASPEWSQMHNVARAETNSQLQAGEFSFDSMDM